jgi:hypothetical protein
MVILPAWTINTAQQKLKNGTKLSWQACNVWAPGLPGIATKNRMSSAPALVIVAARGLLAGEISSVYWETEAMTLYYSTHAEASRTAEDIALQGYIVRIERNGELFILIIWRLER